MILEEKNISGALVQTMTRHRKKGQSVTEYLILVGIIAIGSMFVISRLGEAIKTATGNIVNVFTGQKGGVHRNVEAIRSDQMGRTDLWNSVRRRPKHQSDNDE